MLLFLDRVDARAACILGLYGLLILQQLIFLGCLRLFRRLDQLVFFRHFLTFADGLHRLWIKDLVDHEAGLILALGQGRLRGKQGVDDVLTLWVIVQDEGKLVTLLF